MVYGIALRYLRCRDDANDVVQETFISAYTNYEQYDESKPIGPWIKRIAINSALMYRSEEHTSELQSHFHIVSLLFFFNDPATPEIYTLSLHDALPILQTTNNTTKANRSAHGLNGLRLIRR